MGWHYIRRKDRLNGEVTITSAVNVII